MMGRLGMKNIASMRVTRPPTVAVIGCGAGGMFLCHALETYRRELLEEQHATDALHEHFPQVTCFERASSPGGVWRSKRTFVEGVDEKKDDELSEEVASPSSAEETTNMYEALWTNGAKDGIEFFDYTFDEHFGGPLPVYMPRQALLDYMVSRVTKNCPDFFEKYVQFHTTVESVKFLDTKGQFEIKTFHSTTNERTTTYYDKCLWAAGKNGVPKMPTSIVSLLRDGGFRGRIIHSSDTADFESDVRGKRVLLIGGSYSAEDLALMAIKVGAERIFISTRGDENIVSWTRCWPGDKVEILYFQVPVSAKGSTVHFAKTEWKFGELYETSDAIETEVHDIDTVIFCTGYLPNMSMLDNELRSVFDKPYENMLHVPSDWKMTENEWTEVLGDVDPPQKGVYWRPSPSRFPELYRGLFVISNPSMIFLENEDFANPIFGIEGNAWLLMRHLTGKWKLPSAEEMRRQNAEDCLRHMQNPYLRYYMDRNYLDAYRRHGDDKFTEEAWDKFERDYSLTYYRYMARTLQEAEYPGASYGTFDELNETAMTIYHYGCLSYFHRYNLDRKEDEREWRSFRDCRDADKFRSVFTGTRALPLQKRWLDIDAGEEMNVVKSAWPKLT